MLSVNSYILKSYVNSKKRVVQNPAHLGICQRNYRFSSRFGPIYQMRVKSASWQFCLRNQIVIWVDGARPLASQVAVYFGHRAANTLPRIEPRLKVTPRTPCARPRVTYASQPGTKVHVELSFLEGRRHLPIITTTRV